ncbi:MAG TPA: HNH endonuclease [Candidatus Brocadiaceae bacterium]|nr:MAG: HNH endonuclease [Planctomycetes bacterium GWA2_39_15]
MAVHNTSADAANTAVRAFLTEVGEKYWGKIFNTGTGSGKAVWDKIKNQVFKGCCCYCGKHSEKVQMEHLVMFNREEYGLHHPGNIVPCCTDCNKRRKDNNGKHVSWEEHLKTVCKELDQQDRFEERRMRIYEHHTTGEFAYPSLNDNEKHAIRVMAESLYTNIKTEIEKSLELYVKLTDAFVIKGAVESK